MPNGTALQRTGSRCICVMATTVRAITGLTLAAAAIGAVTLLPLLALNAVFLLLLLLAALEWTRFCVISPGLKVAAYGLTVVLVAVATRLLDIQGGIGVPFFVFAAVGWLGVGAAIVCHQRQGGRRKQNLAVVGIFGVVVLASAFSALSYLGELGAKYLLVLFGIVWGADVFAYFGGRRFGKRLLASNISPGKTWAISWRCLRSAARQRRSRRRSVGEVSAGNKDQSGSAVRIDAKVSDMDAADS